MVSENKFKENFSSDFNILVISDRIETIRFMREYSKRSGDRLVKTDSVEKFIKNCTTNNYRPDVVVVDSFSVCIKEFFRDTHTFTHTHFLPLIDSTSSESIRLVSRLGYHRFLSDFQLMEEIFEKIDEIKEIKSLRQGVK